MSPVLVTHNLGVIGRAQLIEPGSRDTHLALREDNLLAGINFENGIAKLIADQGVAVLQANGARGRWTVRGSFITKALQNRDNLSLPTIQTVPLIDADQRGFCSRL